MSFQISEENGLCVTFLRLNFPFLINGSSLDFLETLGGLGKGSSLSVAL